MMSAERPSTKGWRRSQANRSIEYPMPQCLRRSGVLSKECPRCLTKRRRTCNWSSIRKAVVVIADFNEHSRLAWNQASVRVAPIPRDGLSQPCHGKQGIDARLACHAEAQKDSIHSLQISVGQARGKIDVGRIGSCIPACSLTGVDQRCAASRNRYLFAQRATIAADHRTGLRTLLVRPLDIVRGAIARPGRRRRIWKRLIAINSPQVAQSIAPQPLPRPVQFGEAAKVSVRHAERSKRVG